MAQRRPKSTPLPERIPIDASVASLRVRIRYVTRELGYNVAIIALAAQMSEKLLRKVFDPDWNPKLNTLRRLDEAITLNLPRWLEDAGRR